MAVVSPEVAYLYRPAVPRVAGCLHEVCITTLAVLAFFWCSINNLRFQRLVDLYCSYLVEAAGRASAVNRDPINLNVLQFTLRIQYSNVSGWAVAMAGMHSQIAESFKNIGVSKVQLFSSFIYGINYKPFGTGHFGDAKARMLDCFLETEDTDSAIFEKHWVRIAGNFGMRAETEQDKENVLARVADMASFRKRLQPPKLGRWCAWNGCAEEQMTEFCAARMVYEHHLNCEDDGAPARFHSLLAAGRQCSPQAELAALKRADGGFKLAYKLMSDELEIGVKRLYQATHATWEWYTAQVKEVKSPMDGLKYDMRMSAGGWARSPLLQHTVMETFYNYNNLCNMGLPGKAVDLVAQDAAANEVGTLTWHIVSNHAWSLAGVQTIPPYAYAIFFSVNNELRQNAMETMRQESQNMYDLEQISLSVDKARDLADSMGSKAHQMDQQTDEDDIRNLASDPVLEAIYEDMDDEDKKDNEDLKKAFRKQKLHDRIQTLRIQNAAARGKGKGRGKGRGKGLSARSKIGVTIAGVVVSSY